MPYALTVTLPVALIAANRMQRMHWAALGRYKKLLGEELMVAMPPRVRPLQPIQKAAMTIQIYTCHAQDTDNQVASCKPLIDLFLPPGEPRVIRGKLSVPHPGGLSIIADDNPACLALTVLAAIRVRTRKEQRVVVEVSG